MEEQLLALSEANAILQDLLGRYRRSNALLRRLNSALRQKLNIAHANDAAFQDFCNEDISEREEEEGGLPTSDYSQTAGHEEGRDVSNDPE